MSTTLFFACLFLAYGPAISFLALVVAHSSHLLVLAICAAFFELVAFITTSLLYFVIPSEWEPGRDVLTAIIGVLIHETARMLFVWAYGKMEQGLMKASGLQRLPFPDWSSALASGYGFSVMYALLKYGSILGLTLGPGDWYLPSCPHMSVFILSAVLTLNMEILHVVLMVRAFDALRARSRTARIWKWMTIVILHLAVTCSTLATGNASVGGCELALPLACIFTALAVLMTSLLVRSRSLNDGERVQS